MMVIMPDFMLKIMTTIPSKHYIARKHVPYRKCLRLFCLGPFNDSALTMQNEFLLVGRKL